MLRRGFRMILSFLRRRHGNCEIVEWVLFMVMVMAMEIKMRTWECRVHYVVVVKVVRIYLCLFPE